MIIGEAINRIQSLYSKGTASDDSRLSSRHIYNKLLTVRSLMFKRQMNKKSIVSNWNTQTIDCIEMIDATASECNCVGSLNNCDIKRSKYPIPNTISGDMGDTLTVSSIDGYVNYAQTTWDHSKYIIGAKYASQKLYFYIHNSYIYIINSRATSIAVTGIFQDPTTVYAFIQLCDDSVPCIDYKQIDFEMSNDMMDSVIDETSKELIFNFNKFGREDARNDSRDTPLNEAK